MSAIDWIMASNDTIKVGEITPEMIRQANAEQILLTVFVVIIVFGLIKIFKKNE